MSHNLEVSNDGTQRADDQVDLYDRATEQTVDDDILGDSNLGLGNYSEDWLWMQVDSYSKSMFAHSAVTEPMRRRVIDYALTQAAVEAWEDKSPGKRKTQWENDLRSHEDEQMDRRRWIQAKKEALWDVPDPDVGSTQDKREVRREERRELVNEHGAGDLNWVPPFMRLLKARHEASRSLGARVLDNLFGRVSVQKMEDMARSQASGLSDRFRPDQDREP